MATRYEQGRAFEYRVRNALRGAGYTCIRSAGSKGSIDIIAGRDGFVMAIQCKRDGKLPGSERRDLLRDSKHFGAMPVLAVNSKGVVLYLVKRGGKIATRINLVSIDHG